MLWSLNTRSELCLSVKLHLNLFLLCWVYWEFPWPQCDEPQNGAVMIGRTWTAWEIPRAEWELIEELWRIKASVVPVVIGAGKAVSCSLEELLQQIPGATSVISAEMIEVLEQLRNCTELFKSSGTGCKLKVQQLMLKDWDLCQLRTLLGGVLSKVVKEVKSPQTMQVTSELFAETIQL